MKGMRKNRWLREKRRRNGEVRREGGVEESNKKYTEE